MNFEAKVHVNDDDTHNLAPHYVAIDREKARHRDRTEYRSAIKVGDKLEAKCHALKEYYRGRVTSRQRESVFARCARSLLCVAPRACRGRVDATVEPRPRSEKSAEK